jgi:prepilin-type N-terminal cleavage/methylation domain-containing protein
MTIGHKQKGFTLIELLVVISIIGLLSVVAMTSLNAARLKARDSAIMSAANAIMKAAAIDATASQSYSTYNFLRWGTTTNSCDTAFASVSNPASVRNACNSIVNNMGTVTTTSKVYMGSARSGTYPNRPRFSIMVYLPGANKYYCVGSHGASSTCNTSYNCPGCLYDNSAQGA